jgi:hypothetical protein
LNHYIYRVMRTVNIVFRDVSKEIFREKIGYIVFIFFLIGLFHTMLQGFALQQYVQIPSAIKNIVVQLRITIVSLFYFIIIAISLMMGNSIKNGVGKKYALLFFGISSRKVVLYRIFAFLMALFLIMLLWYLILFIVNISFFHIPSCFFWKVSLVTIISVYLITPLPIFFSLKLSGISIFLTSAILVSIGFLKLFYALGINAFQEIKNITSFLPDWSFIVLASIKREIEKVGVEGFFDISVSMIQIAITIAYSLLFIFLVFHFLRKIEI